MKKEIILSIIHVCFLSFVLSRNEDMFSWKYWIVLIPLILMSEIRINIARNEAVKNLSSNFESIVKDIINER